MYKEVDIKIKAKVDDSDMEKFSSRLKNLEGENIEIKAVADTDEAEADLEKVRKIIHHMDTEGNNITYSFSVEGDDKVFKTMAEAEARRSELDGKETTLDFKAEGIDSIVKDVDGAEKATGNFHETVEKGSTAWDTLQRGASGAIDGILGGLESATGKMSEFLGSMSGVERVFTGVLGAVGVKSLNDLTIANAKAADTNRILMGTMTGTAAEAKNLWAASDKATNSSLMSMRELVPTMSAFQAQTGATAKQMELYAETAAKVGSKSLALGYSSEVTTTALMGMGNALEGSYQVLQKYGITEQTLLNTGLWTGKKEDIEGFLLAIQAAVGDIDDLMDGIEGKERSVFKKLSVAGREWGEMMTPIIEGVYDGFLGLNNVTDGWVAKATVGAAGIVSTFAMIAPQLEASFNLFGSISKKIGELRKGVELVEKASKGTKILSNGVTGSAIVKHTAELNANTAALGVNTPALKTNSIARATSSGGNVGKGAAAGISQIGNVGAAAGSAAPGAAAGSKGLSVLSGSLTSMIIPILKISAVVAIIIPIIAALAAEVLIFVRLLGELVKWLGFDKLNLKPAIEGIKQIGSAMWEIMRAFTVMAAINIVGVVYNATGGILGTIIALTQFSLAMKEIESVLKSVNSLQIDQSVVTKINQVSSVLQGVALAMVSMAGLNLSGLVTFLTGGVDAVKTNIKNLEEIATAINELTLPAMDTSKVELVNKLAESVKKLSEASKAVDDATGWFNEKVLNIDDVNGIRATLENLGYIANHINQADIATVDTAKVELVNALAQVVKPLAEASKTVKEVIGWFNSEVLSINDVEGIQATLTNLGYISVHINKADIESIGKDKLEAIKNLNDAIQPIVAASKAISENAGSIIATPAMAEPFGNAIGALYVINQRLNSTAFSIDEAKVEAIGRMKTVIEKVAEIGLYLSSNSGNIGSNITKNAEALSNSINSLYTINQNLNSKAFQVDESKVTQLDNLKKVIFKIAEIGLDIDQNSGNLGAISDNSEAISKAIDSLKTLNDKINGITFEVDEAKTAALSSLKSMISDIVSTLNAAAGVQSAASSMGKQMIAGFTSQAIQLKTVAKAEVDWAINAVNTKASAMWTAGSKLGSSLVRGFRDGLNSNSPGLVAAAAAMEMVFTQQALANALPQLESLGMEALNSISSGFGSGLNRGSPGDIANMMKDEMNYTAEAISSKISSLTSLSESLAQSIVGGFDKAFTSFLDNISIPPIPVKLVADWSGGGFGSSFSTAGGDISDYQIEYPKTTEYHYHLESVIVDQNAIDKFGELQRRHKQQEDMRS